MRIARGEHVPVDDGVHAALVGFCDQLVDERGEVIGIGLVAAFLDVHGQSYDVGVPVVGQKVEGRVVDALAVPLEAVGAHAAQLHRLSVLIAQSVTAYR